MPTYRIKQAARLLGVSTDTLRRWVDDGRIETTTDDAGRTAVEGAALARLAQDFAESANNNQRIVVVAESMRNRFTGLVPRVVRGTVMAQVEIQAGRTGSCRCSAARPPTSSAWSPVCSPSLPSRPPASW